MKIGDAIENVYQVFSSYTTSDMAHCDCGCIDEADVRRLASKRLRELEEDDLCSYHGSALYTWGEVGHYKHFLPRILELIHSHGPNSLIELDEVVTKLEYAQWQSWPGEERIAIQKFVLAHWHQMINKERFSITPDGLKSYAFFIEPKEIVDHWSVIEEENGLRNFVQFFYWNGSKLINSSDQKNAVFDAALMTIVNDDNLLACLETAFFKAEEADKPYAEQVSLVMQMIEQLKPDTGGTP